MKPFSYAAAYVDEETSQMLKSFGLSKSRFHVTTCFDSSASLAPADIPEAFEPQSAIISAVSEWETPFGRFLVAELAQCPWTAEANAAFLALGVVEDLPHHPHVTLIPHCQPGDGLALQSLIGQKLVFDRHAIFQKLGAAPAPTSPKQ